MKRSVILLFTLLGSCLGKVSTDTEYHRQLVVEGRIEAGGPAEVMLSENLPFLDVITEQTLEAAVVRYAKVTVTSDDGQSEILTGYYDRNYPTRFVYRSARLHGRTGGTYTLTVDYRGRTCTAVTTVPEPIPLRELRAEPVCDSLFTLQALFDDPPAKNAYFAECRTTDPGAYSPALMGVVDDSVLDNGGSVTLTVNRPLQYLKIKEYKQYFRPGETVDVRFSHISSPTFDFWSRLENEMLAAFGADTAAPTTALRCHRKTIAKKRPFFRRHSSNEFVPIRGLEQTIREIRRSLRGSPPPALRTGGRQRPTAVRRCPLTSADTPYRSHEPANGRRLSQTVNFFRGK